MKNLLLSFLDYLIRLIKNIFDSPILWSLGVGIVWQTMTLFGIGTITNTWSFGNILFACIAGTIVFQSISGFLADGLDEGFKQIAIIFTSWFCYRCTTLPALLMKTDTTLMNGADFYKWIINPWPAVLATTIIALIMSGIFIISFNPNKS
ncbi:MAG: hypothetical protein KBC98_01140 [Candidatus Pacebacteria bacterium]|nr:hypothetical protein [Candidatus Paceibacterota bacterium]